MKPPALPANEATRLAALRSFEVLDTAPDQAFDDLTALAGHICGAPIALISLIDENRQWFKARVGLAACETGRDISFCGHAILQPDLFIIADAALDERFADNPLVTGDPNIRFYAGAPLVTSEGQALGTLCVIDRVPRTLDASQQQALRVLSRHVTALLERRRRAAQLSQARRAEVRGVRYLPAWRTVIAIFVCALLVLMAVNALSVREMINRRVVAMEASRVSRLLVEMKSLFSDVQDAETGQRRYLLTGDEAYLAPYIAARREIYPRLALVEQLGHEFRGQTRNGDELYQLVGQRLDHLELIIALRRELGLEAALAAVKGGSGKAAMDQLRVVFDAQAKEVVVALAARESAADASGQQAVVLLALGTLLSVLMLLTMLLRLRREIVLSERNAIVLRHVNEDMTREIAERERAERKLRDANEELRLATERAEAADRIKSSFLATMSHELRTPLNSIIGFTGIILQGLAGPLNAEQQKQLGMVQASARHLLALINDVLDISKIEAGQLEVGCAPFDLRASIDKVTGIARPLAAAKGLVLQVRLDARLDGAQGDARRVEQVLLNLLSNAIKFTAQGAVTLAAELIDDYRAEGAATWRPAVCLRVSDTGMGVKPQDMAVLFQPFRQIDSALSRNHEGTGLGLAICRRLADLMGGSITAESVWQHGSTFTFTLPLNPENQA